MTGFLNASDFNTLRCLAARWGDGWISARFARELNEALDIVSACRDSGPEFLDADVFGDTIPDLQAAAVAKAAELYGESARLLVESTGTIETSFSPGKGKFTTRVRVRCLNYYPEEDE